MANITGEAVSRFLVNTDDDYEYMYLVKRNTGVSSKTKTELYIVNENSEPIFTYMPEDANVDIYTVWTFNLDCKPTIAVVLRDANDALSIELFSLPLNKFEAGGSGTVEDPYLISTVGDLMQVINTPDAHFRVNNDIDAENITMPQSEYSFTGSIDGGNHVISNLSVASTGLLGSIVGVEPANAYIQRFLTHTFTEWDNAIVIFLQDGTDHVGYQLKAETLGSLRRKHPGMAELIPYFDRVHAMVVAVAELLPTIVVLIELFEIRDLWLLVVDGQGIQMLPNFC